LVDKRSLPSANSERLADTTEPDDAVSVTPEPGADIGCAPRKREAAAGIADEPWNSSEASPLNIAVETQDLSLGAGGGIRIVSRDTDEDMAGSETVRCTGPRTGKKRLDSCGCVVLAATGVGVGVGAMEKGGGGCMSNGVGSADHCAVAGPPNNTDGSDDNDTFRC
jgi:hypothetical protein